LKERERKRESGKEGEGEKEREREDNGKAGERYLCTREPQLENCWAFQSRSCTSEKRKNKTFTFQSLEFMYHLT
jgi:hypothetical protein